MLNFSSFQDNLFIIFIQIFRWADIFCSCVF